MLRHLHHGIALAGILHGLELSRVRGRELHRFRNYYNQVLCRILRLGINLERSRISHGVLDLKLCFAGAEGEGDRIAILLRLRSGFGGNGLSVGSFGLYRLDLRALRQEELKVVVVHLRLRRDRSVVDGEQPLATEFVAFGFETQYVRSHAQVGDFARHVIDLDFNCVRTRGRHLVVGDVLMNGADKVRSAAIRQLETEFTGAVGLGLGSHFHAIRQIDQDYFIAGRGLAGCAVGHRARQ